MINNIVNYSNCIVKITNVWVGSVEVPSDHWQQIVSFQRETLVLLQHDTKSLDLEMEMKKGGAFTFNIGLMMDSGLSSSGLVRLQAEEPNIQVLTADGKNLDFGIVPLDSSASAKLMLVNCGLSSVPLYLELAQPSQVFSFEEFWHNVLKISKISQLNFRSITGYVIWRKYSSVKKKYT